MQTSLQPTYKDQWLTASVTREMKEQVEAFARESGVSKSQALRFMIATFFETHYQKKRVENK
jgi:hypothetical protein